jgi:hypothetical protein
MLRYMIVKKYGSPFVHVSALVTVIICPELLRIWITDGVYY